MAVYFTRKAENGATLHFDDEFMPPDGSAFHLRSGEVAERILRKCARAYELAWTLELREAMLTHMTRHIEPPEERERVQRRIRELSPELPDPPPGLDMDAPCDITTLYELASGNMPYETRRAGDS